MMKGRDRIWKRGGEVDASERESRWRDGCELEAGNDA